MYGDISHWKRFIATTRMPRVRMSKVPARLRITAETRVDKAMIMAIVPAMDMRSFHILITSTPIDAFTGRRLLIFLTTCHDSWQ